MTKLTALEIANNLETANNQSELPWSALFEAEIAKRAAEAARAEAARDGAAEMEAALAVLAGRASQAAPRSLPYAWACRGSARMPS